MAEYFIKFFYLSDSEESGVVVLLGYNSLRCREFFKKWEKDKVLWIVIFLMRH